MTTPQVDPVATATRSTPVASDRLGMVAMLGVGGALVVLCGGVVAARSRWAFTIGFENAGSSISNTGLAIQLAAMVAGVVAVNLTTGRVARGILVVEGAICLVSHGGPGLAYAAGVLSWYGALSVRWLGRARLVVAFALLAGMNTCAFAGGRLAAAALVFSMIFTMRLIMYAWDRQQHEFERPPVFEYLIYMLPAPLVIMPPYMIIIPLFSGFAAKIRPGITRARLGRIAAHLGLAVVFGALRGGVELAPIAPAGPAWLYWNLLSGILTAAAFAHLFLALLLLHGIEERRPLDRPVFARRFLAYWSRYQVHLKDAQVFLFFTPALLALRRWNRYLALTIATTMTMIVGNTALHIAARYCFLPSLWDRVRWVLLVNVVMAAALSVEMCMDEWRSRRRAQGQPAGDHPPGLLSWAITMTLAAIAST